MDTYALRKGSLDKLSKNIGVPKPYLKKTLDYDKMLSYWQTPKGLKESDEYFHCDLIMQCLLTRDVIDNTITFPMMDQCDFEEPCYQG